MGIELEHLRARVEGVLSRDLVADMQRLGVQLILRSSSAYADPTHDFQPVTIDPDLEDDEEAYMPSFRKDATGVDNTIWISTKGKGRHEKRVKVAIAPPDALSPYGGTTASVAFTGEVVAGDIGSSKLLRQVRQFTLTRTCWRIIGNFGLTTGCSTNA